MGLDTTHNCWHGSYGGFSNFREAIAECIGIPLPLMDGFLTDGTLAFIPEKLREWLPIDWALLNPDPIHLLLHHSDCDGEIPVADQIAIADRLEQILPQLNDEYHQQSARKFIDGLRLAHSKGEPVVFQ